MDIKYTLKILVIILIFLSLIIFINLNKQFKFNNFMRIINVEGLQNNIHKSSPIGLTGNIAFCDYHKGVSLEMACNKLTNDNCNSTNCCVLTNENKCKAGNKLGPIFNTDKNGQTINIDYYYYRNKCYGNRCNKNKNKIL